MTTIEGHAELLEAVAAAIDATLVSFSATHSETTSDGFVNGYDLEVTAADGSPRRHTVYLETRPGDAGRDGVIRFRNDESGDVVDAWVYPGDPALPALSATVFPEAAAIVLARLGQPIERPELTVLAYRPGKRAVIRATGDDRQVYLKVVRPELAEPLHELHEIWRAHGIPVPRSLGWSSHGLLALEALPGREASDVVESWREPEVFLAGVHDLMQRIASVPSSAPARPSLITRLDWYERRMIDLLPDDRAQTVALCRGIERGYFQAAPLPQPRTIHGDLHASQLRVDVDDPTRIIGVLDIDTAGIGDPADDAAALLAHAIVSALFHRDKAAEGRAAAWGTLAEAELASWSRQTPGDAGFASRARAIAATQLLGHALTGIADPRELLGLADLVLHETPLIDASSSSHTAPGE